MSKKAIPHNFQITTKHTREFRTWFRGEHTNFNPTCEQMLPVDAVPKYVLEGWMPDAPVITPSTQITAFGSCFAANISNWLSSRNFRVLNKQEDAKQAYIVAFGEGMVNSFVIRQQFEWAWENKVFEQPLWHGYDAAEYGYDPEVQKETKRIFDETDVFILTFGLSEVWYDEPTGNVFWRTIPKDVYDPKRHKFRVSTVEENRDNLEAIYQLIRKHRPDAKVIMTLSPIPLIATFRENSCLTSNSVSKSILRVAIDETVRAHKDEGHLFYWPSYELVTDVMRLPYKPDRRHPPAIVLNYIMTLFEHTWCVASEDNPPPSLADAWVRALVASGQLPAELNDIVANRRPWRMRQFYKRVEPLNPDKDLDQRTRRMLASVLEGWIEGERQDWVRPAPDTVGTTDTAPPIPDDDIDDDDGPGVSEVPTMAPRLDTDTEPEVAVEPDADPVTALNPAPETDVVVQIAEVAEPPDPVSEPVVQFTEASAKDRQVEDTPPQAEEPKPKWRGWRKLVMGWR